MKSPSRGQARERDQTRSFLPRFLPTMNSDYFSVDAILAENQENKISESQKIQLPVWLAYTVLYSFVLPSPIRTTHADAITVNGPISIYQAPSAKGSAMPYEQMPVALDDEQAADLSQLLSSTFRSRLPEITDQAHHFAALNSASGSGHKSNDTAQLFREGLDVVEREIFALAQESAKRTKKWYEEGDSNRH
ncbi:hypothetical protein D9756_000873 [Leucocoprinus leucothites]|uniref:DNA replication complex GINS protein PSF3 n=1 Tax=Leucocoprinus leucothites TaxID=201217 RepID=A0A8H5GE47_9AGAR|nr:hypothetical protein D9756_000873 [Leucoagaricus leucothites]